MVNQNDDDLVMESTTDTPEQIAAGLGVEAEDASPEGAEETVETAPETEPAAVAEPEPVVETPVRARSPRVQRKTADAAAAAARRSATARAKVLEDENQALRDRLAEIAAGAPAPRHADRAAAVVAPAGGQPPYKPSDVPDSHPALMDVQREITALGPRPKQEDFDDYDKYEEAKEAHIEDRARLRARMDFVRQDVAARATIDRDTAFREQQAINDGFAKTVDDARQRHEDYDDVMADATEAGHAISVHVGDALRQSPIGAEVVYYLASNPKEVARLNGLTPYRALAEVGILEGRISAGLRPLRGQPLTAGPRARVTKAPDPQQTYLGDLPSHNTVDLDDPRLSQAEYNRRRDEMDRQSGRRVM